ncbi:MAG: hypothetical protein LPK92_01600 [Actinomycetes bacterium]|nr:hypothetical protein [Actinomycetes bacterium]
MPTYLVIYHAPPMDMDADVDPEARQAAMDAWYGWAESMGGSLLDLGHPLAGGVRVTPEGTVESTNEVAGYSLIEGDSLEAAVASMQSHPHLTQPGTSIEVHEAQPLPGS